MREHIKYMANGILAIQKLRYWVLWFLILQQYTDFLKLIKIYYHRIKDLIKSNGLIETQAMEDANN